MLTVRKRFGRIVDGRPGCEWVIWDGETPVAASLSYVQATDIAAELTQRFGRRIGPDGTVGRRQPLTIAEAVKDSRVTIGESLRYGHLESVLRVQKQTG